MAKLTRLPIDKVGLCLIRDRKFLLARSHGQAVFQIPGGKVEPGDADDLAALVREIDEELGVALDRSSAKLLGVFSAPAATDPDRLVNIKLYRGDIDGEPVASTEIAALRWQDPCVEHASDVSEVVSRQIMPFVRRLLESDA